MAEAHPVGFQWVTEAKARGARVIHVDPRFTRTTAVADKHVPIRTGSDIVLLGALIKYVLDNDLWFKEYVTAFTNVATVINKDYVDAEDNDGVFSGFDPETGQYDLLSWSYATPDDNGKVTSPHGEEDSGKEQKETAGGHEHGAGGPPLNSWHTKQDPTLQHPRSVFQILKRHYSRYTPEMVTEVCGISREDFEYLAKSITENSGRERTTCFAYAVGWTQHSHGAQYIRTAAILQLLLGNIGRPGGGIMALRGHANIQGGTDIPTLFNLLPGYLPMPKAGTNDTLQEYLDGHASKQQKGFWANVENYTVSLLKAWWGDAATKENDWAYDYLPRLTGPHGTYQSVMRMMDGDMDGYFILGQNPAVGSANAKLQRMAMAKLKWLVVRDFNLIESATWWKDGPEIKSGELKTEEIDTEVFYLPAANHTEKAGTFTQTQRLVQWRDHGGMAPGDSQSELQFFYEFGKKLRAKLAGSTDWRDRPLLDLTWDYPVDEHGEPDAEAILKEINGYHLTGEKAGQLLNNFNEMKSDGSTMGGCWIYTGIFADGVNHARKKVPVSEQGIYGMEWGWAWPANRRILYNRASADADGKPWSERKKYIWWDEEAGQWTGKDVPDFPLTLRPDAQPDPHEAGGPAALSGTDAFIMQADGKGWLFAPKGMIDGPLPTHYEAPESQVKNLLYPTQNSPAHLSYDRNDNYTAPGYGEKGAGVYPYVFTTYRLTEHHTAGSMSRWLQYLSELQPEMFCEVSPELAAEKGLEPYGWATIVSAQSAIEARVLVTERMTPLTINGETVHQIGLPYHWAVGDEAVVTGDSTNDLLGVSLDPNVLIQESKSAACDILPGRRPRGQALVDFVEEYRVRAGISKNGFGINPNQNGKEA